MCVDFDVKDNRRGTFSLEEALLRIMDCILAWNNVTRWTGVVWYLWIIVMFLSAVWILILTAPIHCRASIAEQMQLHFCKSDKETNSTISWMTWGWLHFQQILIFGWTVPLNESSTQTSRLCNSNWVWVMCGLSAVLYSCEQSFNIQWSNLVNFPTRVCGN